MCPRLFLTKTNFVPRKQWRRRDAARRSPPVPSITPIDDLLELQIPRRETLSKFCHFRFLVEKRFPPSPNTTESSSVARDRVQHIRKRLIVICAPTTEGLLQFRFKIARNTRDERDEISHSPYVHVTPILFLYNSAIYSFAISGASARPLL